MLAPISYLSVTYALSPGFPTSIASLLQFALTFSSSLTCSIVKLRRPLAPSAVPHPPIISLAATRENCCFLILDLKIPDGNGLVYTANQFLSTCRPIYSFMMALLRDAITSTQYSRLPPISLYVRLQQSRVALHSSPTHNGDK